MICIKILDDQALNLVNFKLFFSAGNSGLKNVDHFPIASELYLVVIKQQKYYYSWKCIAI
jgi:hypothetical protein